MEAGTTQLPDVKPHLPLKQTPALPKAKVDPVASMLQDVYKKVTEQVKSLESQIAKLENDVFKTYSHMNQHAYHLHAICVHDGNAESGHYYTFIYDHF